MPPTTKTGPALFLGLELATDQLRASIVDEALELVGVECVDFDTELSEYQHVPSMTQGGIFTTPGEAYTTPVEMWIRGLDLLFEKLHRNHDLTRIKAISGSAQHALVWWKSTSVPSLSSLDPRLALHELFNSNSFSLPNTPTAQDTSSLTHAIAIEALLGGPDIMSARVGTCAHSSLIAAQLLRVREAWSAEVWQRTGRIQFASAFLCSLICGKWTPMIEAEACATGLWVHGVSLTGSTQQPSHWDEGVLDIIGGSREEGRRVRGWLGEVDTSGGGKRAGYVSRYLVDRYGFDPETIVTPFTSDYLATYLSLLPSSSDAILSFGPMDILMTPAQNYIPTRLYNLFPHPAQDPSEKRRYVAMLTSRNADVPRALVRDMYTKSWSAFDRLVAIVPPGGSIGLDDKLFSFWLLQGDSYPFSHVKGIFRFETGVKANEFRDLRANPRCLLESQIISFRVKWSRMIATGVLGTSRSKGGLSVQPSAPISGRSNSILSSLGLPFDPYDHTPLPARILATGAAANFPSVANLVGDVLNAPVFVPNTQVDSAQVVPHRNTPAQGFPGRATLGSAYVARWVWGRERSGGAGGLAGSGRGLGGFEEEIRRLMGKRWVASGGVQLRTNVNAPSLPIGGNMLGAGGTSSGVNSGASTPFGHPRLGASVVVEEDEDEYESGGTGQGLGHGISYIRERFGHSDIPRIRTQTESTVDTLASSVSGPVPSTAYTTPDLSLAHGGSLSPRGTNGNGSTTPTPTTPTPLTPVVMLPTADAEAQIGLAKVAEPDLDAFMTYASIVPEYCRLESMLVKAVL